MTHPEALRLLDLAGHPDPAAINAAFRRQALKVHPDHHPDKHDAKEAMIQLTAARDLALKWVDVKPPPGTQGHVRATLWAELDLESLAVTLAFGLSDFQDAYNRMRKPKPLDAPEPESP